MPDALTSHDTELGSGNIDDHREAHLNQQSVGSIESLIGLSSSPLHAEASRNPRDEASMHASDFVDQVTQAQATHESLQVR